MNGQGQTRGCFRTQAECLARKGKFAEFDAEGQQLEAGLAVQEGADVCRGKNVARRSESREAP